MQKGFTPILFLVGLAILAVVAASSYYFGKIQGVYELETSLKDTQNPYQSVPPTYEGKTISSDETASWKTYTNSKYSYSIKYPLQTLVEENGDWVWFDKQIFVSVAKEINTPYRGDSVLQESYEDYRLNSYEAKIAKGYVGQVGGNIPQRYQRVDIYKDGLVYSIRVYELKNDSKESYDRELGEISSDKLSLFYDMVATFKFTSP